MRNATAFLVFALLLPVVSSAQPATPGPGLFGDSHWKPPVANALALPSAGNRVGDCRETQDTGKIWCVTALPGTWFSTGGGGITGPGITGVGVLPVWSNTDGSALGSSICSAASTDSASKTDWSFTAAWTLGKPISGNSSLAPCLVRAPSPPNSNLDGANANALFLGECDGTPGDTLPGEIYVGAIYDGSNGSNPTIRWFLGSLGLTLSSGDKVCWTATGDATAGPCEISLTRTSANHLSLAGSLNISGGLTVGGGISGAIGGSTGGAGTIPVASGSGGATIQGSPFTTGTMPSSAHPFMSFPGGTNLRFGSGGGFRHVTTNQFTLDGTTEDDAQGVLTLASVQLLPLATPPVACGAGGGEEGFMYWNSTSHQLCVCNGTAWVQSPGGSPGVTTGC